MTESAQKEQKGVASLDRLFALARELADARTWSTGVEIARTLDLEALPSESPAELLYRVVIGVRDPVRTVMLSPAHELWQCDCSDEDDPCRHVIAVILALRQRGGQLTPASVEKRRARPLPGKVVYSFSRQDGRLSFDRWMVFGDRREQVTRSLRQAVTELPRESVGVAVSEHEFDIDYILLNQKHGVLAPGVLSRLLSALADLYTVELDGAPIRTRRGEVKLPIELRDEGEGFRLACALPEGVTEIFYNGAVVCGGVLAGIGYGELSAEQMHMVQGQGTLFGPERCVELVGQVLPALQRRTAVEVRTRRLPRPVQVPPRVLIETAVHGGGDDSDDSLSVVPRIVYGDPPVAEVIFSAAWANRGGTGELKLLSRDQVPVRDRWAEQVVQREVLEHLELRWGEAKVLQGEAAVAYAQRLQGWATTGAGVAHFTPKESLSLVASASPEQLQFEFVTASGGQVELERVVEAWQRGASVVSLRDGSWASLPKVWLDQHRETLERYFAARSRGERPPPHALPQLASLCDELGVRCPPYLERLRSGLAQVETIPPAELPADLTATLRPYQRHGVNWLSLLREFGINGLMADDMGLGKTLQALCMVRGRTLVVAPTSVLHGWREQVQRFRPGLSAQIYHGAQRRIDPAVDVTITSYALMRIDCEVLRAQEWDLVILDEAQMIRNPDSQVARAAYTLPARAKLTLSGTPVENSLHDLWSQFHFLNPGLLGSRRQFEEGIARRVKDGDREAVQRLRAKVLPFTLRRLKREVAKELPPKTEVVLRCELDARERAVYEALLGATRAEVAALLTPSQGLFTILEALLRLRQACCHTGLLPGHQAPTSSKMELLLDSLTASIEQEHRALVFSQWTSLLDLVEPHLRERGITFGRIDGSTTNRQGVVDAFQRPDGAQVLLLSLKAGGLGLTLTAADHVYIIDPWWNPAVEEQAADRAYRIGQENPVLVHRLVAQNTIEERVLLLQERKRALLTAAVGTSGQVSLSRDEVMELLG